ncbi:MAG: hypothetical protein MI810_07420 [Flavobacteriales bacterium]|nr:hypothetical protein [Flavobacteriales bacterium]
MQLLRSEIEADFVTASRHAEVLSITKSIKPSLLLMSFEDNQSALNGLNVHWRKFSIPVLCINKMHHVQPVRCEDHNIVFFEREDILEQPHSFCLKVRSILKLARLREQPLQKSFVPAGSLVDQQSNYSRNLSRHVMEIEKRNQTLIQVKRRISDLISNVDESTRRELMSIMNSIKVSTSDEKHWDDFKIYFESINPQFLERLSQKFPGLTSRDLKYCCYLKMNMSTEDIKRLLSINSESVRTHKYRLKKKMALSKDQNLRNYLQSFSSRTSTPIQESRGNREIYSDLV